REQRPVLRPFFSQCGLALVRPLLLPYTTLFRSVQIENRPAVELISRFNHPNVMIYADPPYLMGTRYGKQYKHEMTDADHGELLEDRKSTRLNSSHVSSSYAVFGLTKKKHAPDHQ